MRGRRASSGGATKHLTKRLSQVGPEPWRGAITPATVMSNADGPAGRPSPFVERPSGAARVRQQLCHHGGPAVRSWPWRRSREAADRNDALPHRPARLGHHVQDRPGQSGPPHDRRPQGLLWLPAIADAQMLRVGGCTGCTLSSTCRSPLPGMTAETTADPTALAPPRSRLAGARRNGPPRTAPKQRITFGTLQIHNGRKVRGGLPAYPQVNRLLTLCARRDSNSQPSDPQLGGVTK
jgi:hypothetical protein